MPGFKKHQPINEADFIFNATISSNAVAVGDLLTLAVGSTTWTDATASTEHWQLKAIALDSTTTSDTEVRVLLVRLGTIYEAESANNSDAADNGDRMILTDTNTVNNTGTDNTSQDVVVVQIGVVGANTEKRILVTFTGGSGVNPDAV